MPLPQSPQAEPGLLEFCEKCQKCSKHCPGDAIGSGPRSWDDPLGSNPGVFRWPCDEEKCRDYWDQVGTSCTVCYRVCAFAKKKGLHHDIVKWLIRNVPQLNKFWVWSDDLMGYGRMRDPKEYWD